MGFTSRERRAIRRCRGWLGFGPAAVIGLAVAVPSARGVVEPAGADDGDYRALGNQYAGRTVFVLVENQSMVPLGVGSGVLIDPWDVLTAAHVLTTFSSGSGIKATIGTGTNVVSDTGTTTSVSSSVIDPLYDGSDPDSPDLAILHLSQPIGDAFLSIAPPVAGEVLTGSGYGYRALSDGTVNPLDGYIRGWNAPVGLDMPALDGPNFYFQTNFQADQAAVPLVGNAFFGDSGGPWFDAAGSVVGLTIDGPDTAAPEMTTRVLNVSQPDNLEWILANIGGPGDAPEPASLWILAAPWLSILLRRRRTGQS